jgi:CheY-like chemotaxis protein
MKCMIDRPEAIRAPSLSEAGRPHCLVVEDNPTNQFVVAHFLRKLGITLDVAPRGADALRALGTRGYDFVLMDIEMPQLDGYDTTRELRRRELAAGRRRTPVIALSADALPENLERARQAGMDAFLTKPIVIEALARTILLHIACESRAHEALLARAG